MNLQQRELFRIYTGFPFNFICTDAQQKPNNTAKLNKLIHGKFKKE
jgi:hypothetical protein